MTKPAPAKLQFEPAMSFPGAIWERLLPSKRHETRLAIKRMKSRSSGGTSLSARPGDAF
jgi:hypothetical protein